MQFYLSYQIFFLKKYDCIYKKKGFLTSISVLNKRIRLYDSVQKISFNRTVKHVKLVATSPSRSLSCRRDSLQAAEKMLRRLWNLKPILLFFHEKFYLFCILISKHLTVPSSPQLKKISGTDGIVTISYVVPL